MVTTSILYLQLHRDVAEAAAHIGSPGVSQPDVAPTPEHPQHFDVVVVGAGNAAMCAALAAHEGGAEVLVLERAPEAEAGGNSRFTAGAIRFAYDGVDDLRALMPDLTDAEVEVTDFGTYTEDEFYADLAASPTTGAIPNWRTRWSPAARRPWRGWRAMA